MHLVDPHGFALFLHLVIHLFVKGGIKRSFDRLESLMWCLFLNGPVLWTTWTTYLSIKKLGSYVVSFEVSSCYGPSCINSMIGTSNDILTCQETYSTSSVCFLFPPKVELIFRTFLLRLAKLDKMIQWHALETAFWDTPQNYGRNWILPTDLQNWIVEILGSEKKNPATSSCSTPAVECFCSEISTKAWRPRSSA